MSHDNEPIETVINYLDERDELEELLEFTAALALCRVYLNLYPDVFDLAVDSAINNVYGVDRNGEEKIKFFHDSLLHFASKCYTSELSQEQETQLYYNNVIMQLNDLYAMTYV